MGIQRANSNSRISDLNFDLLKKAAKAFPQMQIAVQTRVEKWDARNFVPSVVFLTTDFNEGTNKEVGGFDPAQKPISVSTEKDPDVNYVVVSLNERTTLASDGNLYYSNTLCPVSIESVPYDPSTTPESLPPPEDCDGGGGGGGGGGTGGSGTSHPQYVGTGQDGVLPTLIGSQMGTIVSSNSNGLLSQIAPVGTFNGQVVYRKDFRHEKMRWMKIDRINDIEAWPAGDPEIRMHIFEQNILNPSENLQIYKERFHPCRSCVTNEWYNANGVTMHLWDYAGTGTKFSAGYYEYDPVLVPNETLAQIGGLIVDLLFLQTVDSTTTPNQMTIYGNIRQSVQTGIRSLKKKNGMSEYIGKDDYDIRNNNHHWVHDPGLTNFTTWPDL